MQTVASEEGGNAVELMGRGVVIHSYGNANKPSLPKHKNSKGSPWRRGASSTLANPFLHWYYCPDSSGSIWDF